MSTTVLRQNIHPLVGQINCILQHCSIELKLNLDKTDDAGGKD